MGTKNKPGKYDCYANAHPDEPMFVLLGRDPTAPELVEQWARNREETHGPFEKVDEARACAKAMREWCTDGTVEVSIVVNGAGIHVHPSKPITYERLVDLAGMGGYPSMTWKLRTSNAGGTMSAGASIVPSEGMVFNVVHTGNA